MHHTSLESKFPKDGDLFHLVHLYVLSAWHSSKSMGRLLKYLLNDQMIKLIKFKVMLAS